MSKVEVVCPFCKKQVVVEKSFDVSAHGLNKVQCSHCSKRWEERLTEPGGLTKSAPAPSSELAELRVQLNAQFAELLSKLHGLTERRAAPGPARFNTSGVEKSEVAGQELTKALANGKPLTYQRPETNAAARFQPNGVEKSDTAGQELTKALASGKPATWD
jgi:hypothetical protein